MRDGGGVVSKDETCESESEKESISATRDLILEWSAYYYICGMQSQDAVSARGGYGWQVSLASAKKILTSTRVRAYACRLALGAVVTARRPHFHGGRPRRQVEFES